MANLVDLALRTLKNDPFGWALENRRLFHPTSGLTIDADPKSHLSARHRPYAILGYRLSLLERRQIYFAIKRMYEDRVTHNLLEAETGVCTRCGTCLKL